MNRRDFIKQGSLWISGGLLIPRMVGAWGVPTGKKRSGVAGCEGTKGSSDITSDGLTALAYTTKYVHSGGNCLINFLELYCDNNAASNLKMATWSDDSAPDVILAYTAGIAAPTSFAWAGAALNTSILLEDAVTYWFGFRADGELSYKYLTGAASQTYYEATGDYAGFPGDQDPWFSANTTNRIIAIRASYQ